MRASVITETGGLDVMTVKDVPVPKIEPTEILVEVSASAVNHTDIWIRRGYEGNPPIITGIDVAGTVTQAGRKVDHVAVDDRVVLYWNTTYCGKCEACHDGETTMCREYGGLGVNRDGGHAEYVAVDARHAVLLPDHISFKTAAAAASNFATAWRALVTRADVDPGEEVLVIGASGAVGHGAVQIASHAGATVHAATSSAEKAEKLRALGADHVINYTKTTIEDAVNVRTDHRGVDVAFESVGGETYPQAVRSLARGGRVVTIGATSGEADQALLHHVFWNQLRVIGSTGATMGEFEDMLAALFAGHIEPVIDRVISLEEIPAAHDRLSSGKGFGRILVQP